MMIMSKELYTYLSINYLQHMRQAPPFFTISNKLNRLSQVTCKYQIMGKFLTHYVPTRDKIHCKKEHIQSQAWKKHKLYELNARR
jgi:hypothetical protein